MLCNNLDDIFGGINLPFKKTNWIIGYGSLIHKKEVAEFSSSKKKQVIIKDWKRIFNLPSIGLNSVLNVIQSKNSLFNAIAFQIDNKYKFEDLLWREGLYKIQKINAFDYYTLEKCDGDFYLFTAFNFLLNNNNIKPRASYLNLCKNGAYSWGKDFGLMFEETTYLCDGDQTINYYHN